MPSILILHCTIALQSHNMQIQRLIGTVFDLSGSNGLASRFESGIALGIYRVKEFGPRTPPPSVAPDGTGDTPPPKSPVVTNDAHRTSSPGGRYFFAQSPIELHKICPLFAATCMVNECVMRQMHRWHTKWALLLFAAQHILMLMRLKSAPRGCWQGP